MVDGDDAHISSSTLSINVSRTHWLCHAHNSNIRYYASCLAGCFRKPLVRCCLSMKKCANELSTSLHYGFYTSSHSCFHNARISIAIPKTKTGTSKDAPADTRYNEMNSIKTTRLLRVLRDAENLTRINFVRVAQHWFVGLKNRVVFVGAAQSFLGNR